MLDAKIRELARKTATVQIKDLEEPLAMAILGIRSKMRDYGHMWLYMMKRYEEEVAKRAELIWRNLHRAHSSFGAPMSEQLRYDLRSAFREELDAEISNMAPKFQQHFKGAPQSTHDRTWNAKLGDARDHELARFEAEIEHYVATLEATRARGTPQAVTYNVHGSVGAIVSGAGASASVVQHIASEQRDALINALELVKETIRGAPDLVERDQSELVDLADEAGAEAAKEKPNGRRLGLALQNLASAVQGIASGPGAYEALRNAAAAIGLAL
jgi:hypothetical protein